MKIEFTDPLVEKAVGSAVALGPHQAEYHRERERLYEIEDPEAREAAFQAFHRRWFLASRLEEPFREALAEVPSVEDGVACWCVSEAARKSEEGAELYVSDDATEVPWRERRVLVLRLLPATLTERTRLLWLLRRELLYIADMVDPAFGYEPRLPSSDAGPVYDELLRKRYAVLWSTSVLGRLERRGRAPCGARSAARARFLSAFSMLEAKAEETFESLFGDGRPSHGKLVTLACEPRGTVEDAQESGIQENGIRCPVCGFPSYVCEAPDSLEREVVAYLRQEMPHWRPDQGLCPRCADLYRVRAGVFARTPLRGPADDPDLPRL